VARKHGKWITSALVLALAVSVMLTIVYDLNTTIAAITWATPVGALLVQAFDSLRRAAERERVPGTAQSTPAAHDPTQVGSDKASERVDSRARAGGQSPWLLLAVGLLAVVITGALLADVRTRSQSPDSGRDGTQSPPSTARPTTDALSTGCPGFGGGDDHSDVQITAPARGEALRPGVVQVKGVTSPIGDEQTWYLECAPGAHKYGLPYGDQIRTGRGPFTTDVYTDGHDHDSYAMCVVLISKAGADELRSIYEDARDRKEAPWVTTPPPGIRQGHCVTVTFPGPSS